MQERLAPRAARALGRPRAVLDRVGARARRLDDPVRLRLVLRAARVRHAHAHAARRPPEPPARLLRDPADAVRAGRDAPVQRLHGVHPGLRLLRAAGDQRARQRSVPLPRAHRQDPVGHHGLRLRHEPRAGAAAARPAELPGPRRVPRPVPGARRRRGAGRPGGREPTPAASAGRARDQPLVLVARVRRRRGGGRPSSACCSSGRRRSSRCRRSRWPPSPVPPARSASS